MRSRARLGKLIEARLLPGADIESIDRQIEETFGETWSVVFTVMAGFSRRAHRRGIIPFLAMIHQLERIAFPIIFEHAGLVLKRIADSHLLLFRKPRSALAACLELQHALARHNDGVVEVDRIEVGCGIGYGPMLKLGDEDVYGVEVNFAAKLGEDIAEGGEVLVTPSAVDAIGPYDDLRFARVAAQEPVGMHFRAEAKSKTAAPSKRSASTRR